MSDNWGGENLSDIECAEAVSAVKGLNELFESLPRVKQARLIHALLRLISDFNRDIKKPGSR